MVKYQVSSPHLTSLETRLVTDALLAVQLTQGPYVAQFEENFANYLNVPHVVACSSGTTALHLALSALDVGPGDEVIVPDLSFIATTNAVTYTGAKPVLVDVDRETWGIDADKLEEKITSKTCAIIIVHLYGRPVDIVGIGEVAKKHKLWVIEDAAEALGGWWRASHLGTLGVIGTFSFFGNKIITTGEGGAAVTHDPEIARRLRLYRGQGQDPNRRYFHKVLGFNYRLTDIQAALGIAQLSDIENKLKAREEVMRIYRSHFAHYDHTTVEAAPWLFTMVLPERVNRDRLISILLKKGVETRPIFVPMHEQPMYHASASDFPVSAHLGAQGISLPTHPGLLGPDVEEIAWVVKNAIVEEAGEAA